MQTFIPYRVHASCAAVLDRQRLGKQRVECKQIIIALAGESKGWINHPATRMWRGHERMLIAYAMSACLEWKSRGYVDNLSTWFYQSRLKFDASTLTPPVWWGRQDVHDSHKAQLLRKNLEHYRAAFNLTDEQVDELLSAHEGYVWPV